MSQEIESTIAQLEAWRDRITSTIETLRYFLAQGSGLPAGSPPPGGRQPSRTEIPHDAFFQMTIPDAAEKYLSIAKHTKPSSEIADALLSGGLKSAAKNFTETVRSIVSRDERFIRVNGEWGLGSWYPAMRKERGGSKRSPASAPHKTHEGDGATNKPKQEERGHVASATRNVSHGETVRARIIRFLDEHCGQSFSPVEVSKHTGAKNRTARDYLAALFSEGLIDRPSLGHYQSKKRDQSTAA